MREGSRLFLPHKRGGWVWKVHSGLPGTRVGRDSLQTVPQDLLLHMGFRFQSRHLRGVEGAQ